MKHLRKILTRPFSRLSRIRKLERKFADSHSNKRAVQIIFIAQHTYLLGYKTSCLRAREISGSSQSRIDSPRRERKSKKEIRRARLKKGRVFPRDFRIEEIQSSRNRTLGCVDCKTRPFPNLEGRRKSRSQLAHSFDREHGAPRAPAVNPILRRIRAATEIADRVPSRGS